MFASKIDVPFGVLRLRPESDDDATFRFALFCQSRPEWALLPLHGEARLRLLRQQFRAQTASYRARWPDARFDIIELDEEPVGRVVVDRTDDELRLVDIALLASHRNRGIGTSIVSRLIAEARAARLPARLDAAVNNPAALRLYRRLGFVPVAAAPPFVELEWWPAAELER
jgi:ribosomal protein S18 acetylase RimI-like enzyme